MRLYSATSFVSGDLWDNMSILIHHLVKRKRELKSLVRGLYRACRQKFHFHNFGEWSKTEHDEAFLFWRLLGEVWNKVGGRLLAEWWNKCEDCWVQMKGTRRLLLLLVFCSLHQFFFFFFLVQF